MLKASTLASRGRQLYVRIHNGLRYHRLFLKLDEFVYHENCSGSGARCDFLKSICDIGHFGKRDINHGDGQSLYCDQLSKWITFCHNDEHQTMKECDCLVNFEEIDVAEILEQMDSDHLGSGTDIGNDN